MKLIPKYSYEFNQILNENFNENEQVKNFASIITDKDRFLMILPLIDKNIDFIEKKLGFKLKEESEFYITRSEKFKSFSEPITIEYSMIPEEMLLFLLKELIKVNCTIRFPDEVTREQYVNSFIDYFSKNAKLDDTNLKKFIDNLHNESKKLYKNYENKELDFENKTFKQHLEELYNNN